MRTWGVLNLETPNSLYVPPGDARYWLSPHESLNTDPLTVIAPGAAMTWGKTQASLTQAALMGLLEQKHPLSAASASPLPVTLMHLARLKAFSAGQTPQAAGHWAPWFGSVRGPPTTRASLTEPGPPSAALTSVAWWAHLELGGH